MNLKKKLDYSYDLEPKGRPATTSMIKSIRNNSADVRKNRELAILEDRLNEGALSFKEDEAELLHHIYRELRPVLK